MLSSSPEDGDVIANALRIKIVPVTPIEQNCLIITAEGGNADGSKATVIDPGGDIDKIYAYLAPRGLRVERILITHLHIDHIGALDELAAREKAPVFGPHRDDAKLLDHLDAQAAVINIPTIPAPIIENWLTHGDIVEIAGHEFTVRHCPGHTPGHIIFVSQALKLVIDGDTLFAGSVGRTDLPFADQKTMIETIKSEIMTLDDEALVYPGHGPCTTIGKERASNPFLT